MIFLEMSIFSMTKLVLENVVSHELLAERMLTNHVAIGKTVPDRVQRNGAFGCDIFLLFVNLKLILFEVVKSVIDRVCKCVTVVVERRLL